VIFKAIQDAVLSDRFEEPQRADAKNWINHRGGWIWTLEPWTFRSRTSTQTITGATLSAPAGLGPVRAVLLADGTRLAYVEPALFFDRYTPATTGASPEAYTVLGGVIFVAPGVTGTLAGVTVIDDAQWTMLVGDNDVPTLPAEFHFALVHGGSAEGLKLQNDPTWLAFEQDFQASIQAMRASYLEEQRDQAREPSWQRWSPW
jgi:hypothetical protein